MRNGTNDIFSLKKFLALGLLVTITSTSANAIGSGVPRTPVLPQSTPVVAVGTAVVSGKANEEIKSDLVVVSKNPDIFTNVLGWMTFLISVITILIGVATGAGLLLIDNVRKEKNKLTAGVEILAEKREQLFLDIEAKKSEHLKELETRASELYEAMVSKSHSYLVLERAKKEIRELLSNQGDLAQIHVAVNRTLERPDEECLDLYGELLERYGTDIDIVRLVKNGIQQFRRT